MWKNSLKNVESDNNKILYQTLHNFFLQTNGTYFLKKPRSYTDALLIGCYTVYLLLAHSIYPSQWHYIRDDLELH